MVMMVVEPVFIDTNNLIYASESESPFFAIANQRILELRSQGAELWLSRQVLREFLVNRSRPQEYAIPLSPTELVSITNQFTVQFHIAEDNAAVTAKLLQLIQEVPVGGKQIHDANIVATMLVYGIPKLLTHNVSDFKRFENYIEVLPLLESHLA